MPKFGKIKIFQVFAHKACRALEDFKPWCEVDGLDTDDVDRMISDLKEMGSLDSFTSEELDEFLSDFDDKCLELVNMVTRSIKNDPSGKELYDCLVSGFFLDEVER